MKFIIGLLCGCNRLTIRKIDGLIEDARRVGHEGLKILWLVMAVRVQVPLRVQKETSLNGLSLFFMIKSFPKLLTGLFQKDEEVFEKVLDVLMKTL